METSDYENVEVKKSQMGGKIIRKVTIKNGKGYKSVTKYHKGRKVGSIKKPIHKKHIHLIKRGIFVPNLFSDCKSCRTRKNRK
jgi:hypothetical protein